MTKKSEKINKKIARHISMGRGNSGQAGFGLLIILLVMAIIALLAGTYYSTRAKNAQETKKNIERQAEQMQQQVEKQTDELERNLQQSINGSTTEEGTSEIE